MKMLRHYWKRCDELKAFPSNRLSTKPYELDSGSWRPRGSAGPGSRPPRRPGALPDRQLGRRFGSVSDRRRRGFPVILIDANLLVYAHVASVPQHPSRSFLVGPKAEWNRHSRFALAKPSELCPDCHQSTGLRTTIVRCHGLGANRKLVELPDRPDSQSRRPV
jgi:hypothetical protein